VSTMFAEDVLVAAGRARPAVEDPYRLDRFMDEKATVGPSHPLYGYCMSRLFHPGTVFLERHYAATYDGTR
jgi:hypothetical protein